MSSLRGGSISWPGKCWAEAYGGAAGNTGRVEVQVASLTERIDALLRGHFRENLHDYHGFRGLQGMIARRRALLAYLRRTCLPRYSVVVHRLGLRK